MDPYQGFVGLEAVGKDLFQRVVHGSSRTPQLLAPSLHLSHRPSMNAVSLSLFTSAVHGSFFLSFRDANINNFPFGNCGLQGCNFRRMTAASRLCEKEQRGDTVDEQAKPQSRSKKLHTYAKSPLKKFIFAAESRLKKLRHAKEKD